MAEDHAGREYRWEAGGKRNVVAVVMRSAVWLLAIGRQRPLDGAPCFSRGLDQEPIRRNYGAPEITGENAGAIFPTDSSRVVFSRGSAGLGRRPSARLRVVQIVNGRINRA